MAGKSVPKTRIHPETGVTLHRGERDMTVEFKGMKRVVRVKGWFPEGSDDGILWRDDGAALDAALAEMKAEYAANAQRLASKVCEKVVAAVAAKPSLYKVLWSKNLSFRKEGVAYFGMTTKKLFTKKSVSSLLTGSPNSFSKYATGQAQPSHPTMVLLYLLDRRPELMKDIVEALGPDVLASAAASAKPARRRKRQPSPTDARMTEERSNPSEGTAVRGQGAVRIVASRPIRNFADLFAGGGALNDAYARIGMLMAGFAAVERTIIHIQWDLFVANERLSGNADGATPAPMTLELARRLDAVKATKPWTNYLSPKKRIDEIESALTGGNVAAALARAAVASQMHERWRALGVRGKALADRRNEAAHHSVAIAFKPDGPAPIRIGDPFGPSTPISAAQEQALLAAIADCDRDMRSFRSDLGAQLPIDERYQMVVAEFVHPRNHIE